MDNPYLERLLKDIELAEYCLRYDIQKNRSSLQRNQENVDRLHKLITTYLKSKDDPNG